MTEELPKGSASTYRMEAAPPPVAAPSPKSQEMVLVRRSEIRAIRRGVERAFSEPIESAYTWASVWLGVGLAALLGLLALVGVEGNDVRPGIIAAHGAAIIIGFFLAGFCGWMGRKNRGRRSTAQQDLCAELDELDERAPTTVNDQAATSR